MVILTMPHFRLATKAGRRAALLYAASPGCDETQAKRVRQLATEADAADKAGDWRRCLLLTECLNVDCPTPKEREETAAEVRDRWRYDVVMDSNRRPPRSETDRCLYCGKEFRNTIALLLHVRERHSSPRESKGR